MNSKKKFFTRRRVVLLALLAAVLVLAGFALDSRLLVQYYTVETDKINSPVRIALVTDLHSCYYGENQSDLIRTIDEQKPDILLLGGDIFDDVKENTNTELFLQGIAGRYPCYYVTGNHECWSGTEGFARQMAMLEKHGVRILSGEAVTLTVNGETFNLCGIDDPQVFVVEPYAEPRPGEYLDEYGNKMVDYTERLNTAVGQAQEGYCTVLLSHRPEFFELYQKYDVDLVLCGHTHGGQWRIPYLLNGLVAPHQGFFPKYAGGRYDAENMTMIISRGLARETTKIPRVFNRPELVIVELE